MLSQIFGKMNSKTNYRKELEKQIYTREIHQWIKNDKYIYRGINLLLESFTERIAWQLLQQKPLTFIKANGILSCTINSPEKMNIVLIFPELIKKLRSADPLSGVSVLAHEIGHLYYQHSNQKINTLEAQIQADNFVYQLGFGNELQDVLLDFNDDMDVKVRVSRLTTSLIGEKQDN